MAILELVDQRLKSFEEELKGVQSNLRGVHAKIRGSKEDMIKECGDALEKVGKDYAEIKLSVGQIWNRIRQLTLACRPRIKDPSSKEEPVGGEETFSEEPSPTP